jgi:hypothetical protein
MAKHLKENEGRSLAAGNALRERIAANLSSDRVPRKPWWMKAKKKLTEWRKKEP